jgi:hypothetical protein
MLGPLTAQHTRADGRDQFVTHKTAILRFEARTGKLAGVYANSAALQAAQGVADLKQWWVGMCTPGALHYCESVWQVLPAEGHTEAVRAALSMLGGHQAAATGWSAPACTDEHVLCCYEQLPDGVHCPWGQRVRKSVPDILAELTSAAAAAQAGAQQQQLFGGLQQMHMRQWDDVQLHSLLLSVQNANTVRASSTGRKPAYWQQVFDLCPYPDLTDRRKCNAFQHQWNKHYLDSLGKADKVQPDVLQNAINEAASKVQTASSVAAAAAAAAAV